MDYLIYLLYILTSFRLFSLTQYRSERCFLTLVIDLNPGCPNIHPSTDTGGDLASTWVAKL